jgi:hypothetical protein
MKKLLFTIAAFVIATFTYAQKTAADVAKFENETIELGAVKQNSPATAKFIVTNISNEPLIIEQANPTCGCTISDYTKEPIAPGKTGYINATYNAANAGHFDKHLTVKFAGVDEMKTITISGDVKAGEDSDANTTTEVRSSETVTPVTPVVAKTAPAKKKTAAKKTTTKK